MVLCLNPISFNTLLSDVLPPEKTPSFRSFDCRWSNKVKGSSVQNSPTKIFDSDRFSFLSYNESFVCLFLGIENPPFLLYSILALTIDDSEIRTWRNEYQTKLQRKYFIPVAFEILCFTLMETLDFFASCSKYSSPIAS